MKKYSFVFVAALMAGIAAGPAFAEKVLTVGTAAPAAALTPATTGYAALNLAYLTWEPLIARDLNDDLKPVLAESWEEIEPTRWRFNLREGVTWHDGTPFTSADVVYTIEYILDPDTVHARKSRIAGVIGAEAIDELTVDLITEGPAPTLLRGLSDVAIEQKAIGERLGATEAYATPIGTGPFIYHDWTPSNEYTVLANDGYWGGRPNLDRVVMRMIPEASTRVASLLAGETDIIEEVPVDLIATVEAQDGLSIMTKESSVSFVLSFDTFNPPFDDARLREAVDLAINKPLLNERMLNGLGTVLSGQLVTQGTFGFNPEIEDTPYDPDRAREIISEVGLSEGFQNTISLVPGRYLSDLDIVNAVAGMLSAVGLPTTVNIMENAAWARDTSSRDLGPMHNIGWFSMGDAAFNTVWYTEAGNRNFWLNEEFDTLWAEAGGTTDEDERLVAYHRMMEIMHEERPAIFLFGLPRVGGVSDRVIGWEQSRDAIHHLHTVDVKE